MIEAGSTRDEAPSVSVVMAALNAERFLAPAMESILNQTLRDMEFVIVDDGSTDSTCEMLRAYAARDPRIVVLRNDQNRGVPYSANAGLRAARGRYIARMDADDVCDPRRLETQVRHLEKDPGIGLLGSGYRVIDEAGSVRSTDSQAVEPYEFRWISYFRPPVLQPSAMFRADLVRDHGLHYRDDAFPAADFAMWGDMLRHGEGRVISDVLVSYRRHAAQISTAKIDRQRRKVRDISVQRARQDFPEIDIALIEAAFDYLSPPPNGARAAAAQAAEGLRALEAAFAARNGLSEVQRRRLRAYAARWFAMGLMRSESVSRPVQGVRAALAGRSFGGAMLSETASYARRRLSR